MCITTYPDIFKSRLGTWFEPNKHLVEFNYFNCVEVIKYYLKNEEERKRIAESGHSHWKATCSADVFWPKLFDIAGV
jgi:spore maturation protein CgeB